ncbi:predicted protein [Naegleria gruberi]|uniref:Predicted protein n=1 Tax=Naegleria gruberi TaxID=5762 RepID=D2VKY9_NAEGR|nr:uncharacterized protein NAEGRDRAFT_69599 [Naegleria gruberi]EFC42527.1 predicted protein [Naegleria gruberi]|eukprot:XP_002675271.1 predicted protein [Naegleria gruberi strain NEG-M]
MTSVVYCTDPKVIKSLCLKYDTSGRGVFGVSDLKKIMDDLGFNFCKEEIQALEMYLDKNSDGHVSFEEFEQYWIKIASTSELSILEKRIELLTQAADIFRKYDVDSNRVISLSEFEKFYRELYEQNKNASMKEVEEAMKSLDTNSDSVISFQEFIIWLNWLNLN